MSSVDYGFCTTLSYNVNYIPVINSPSLTPPTRFLNTRPTAISYTMSRYEEELRVIFPGRQPTPWTADDHEDRCARFVWHRRWRFQVRYSNPAISIDVRYVFKYTAEQQSMALYVTWISTVSLEDITVITCWCPQPTISVSMILCDINRSTQSVLVNSKNILCINWDADHAAC